MGKATGKFNQFFKGYSGLTLQILAPFSFQDLLMKNNKRKQKSWVSYFILLFFFSACGPTEKQIQVGALDHFRRGNQHQENLGYTAALQEYKIAINQDPSQSVFYYNQGLAYQSLYLYERAIASYNQALKLDPQLKEAWFNLSLALDKINEVERAFLAYERYQKLSQ
ncbi:MAG: hypothetical protein COB67_08040 [SAR324 cluster bacterium]|uniref:Uncharacterized protein n=1 Tax=SAR324 cluster bacterium TaxID=2024889 RepID=A0A2A4T3B2_9DELT|nr:MAG: hypothetical protein COB67_08040 [SAR324 cluster bacterium]